jgi:tetraacyldisaccharide 4'-kinase
LRQEIKVLKNFDAVFFKSIKNINNEAVKLIQKINPKINIFNYNLKILDKNKFDLSKKYFVMSGIGNSESFSKFLKFNKFKIQKYIEFPDHHQYTEVEINDIIHEAKIANSKILTTEKDFVKIPKKYIREFKCLKVSVILENEKKLINFLKLKINE